MYINYLNREMAFHMYFLGKLKMYKIYFLVHPFYLLKKNLYKRLNINCM